MKSVIYDLQEAFPNLPSKKDSSGLILESMYTLIVGGIGLVLSIFLL